MRELKVLPEKNRMVWRKILSFTLGWGITLVTVQFSVITVQEKDVWLGNCKSEYGEACNSIKIWRQGRYLPTKPSKEWLLRSISACKQELDSRPHYLPSERWIWMKRLWLGGMSVSMIKGDTLIGLKDNGSLELPGYKLVTKSLQSVWVGRMYWKNR